ncbi:hypothetical protein [Pedobacter sp. Leaf194]|uniref:hypothetical protein n=1 Tax=Pedobacter sp. Leaf194 TaxID=1736297 RepID=UPI000702BC63|nr:hypothetical protein [Pedobacter sp. Leaf194]KQS41635.1 hypothetical protein ASG14_04035 [Pedobacter sp. Leaf194]
MSLSKNSNEKETNEEVNKNLNIASGEEADLDNDTYGHSTDASAFKRKNEPQEGHGHHGESGSSDEKVESSEQLKNINLSGADLSDSSGDTEKGIGGRQL